MDENSSHSVLTAHFKLLKRLSELAMQNSNDHDHAIVRDYRRCGLCDRDGLLRSPQEQWPVGTEQRVSARAGEPSVWPDRKSGPPDGGGSGREAAERHTCRPSAAGGKCRPSHLAAAAGPQIS